MWGAVGGAEQWHPRQDVRNETHAGACGQANRLSLLQSVTGAVGRPQATAERPFLRREEGVTLPRPSRRTLSASALSSSATLSGLGRGRIFFGRKHVAASRAPSISTGTRS